MIEKSLNKVTLFITLCCLLLVFPQVVNAGKVSSEKADQLYLENKYADALKIYESILKTDYRNSYVLSMAGLCYNKLNNYPKAKEKLRLATLYINPEDKSQMAQAYSNLSSICANLGEKDKFFEYASKAYAIHPDTFTLWNATSACFNMGAYADGLKLLNDTKVEKTPKFFFLYGCLHSCQKNYRQSIASFEKCLKEFEGNRLSSNVDVDDVRRELLYSYLNAVVTESEKTNEAINDTTQIENLYDELQGKNRLDSTAQYNIINEIKIINYNYYPNSYNSTFKRIYTKHESSYSFPMQIDWLNATECFEESTKRLNGLLTVESQKKNYENIQNTNRGLFKTLYIHYLVDAHHEKIAKEDDAARMEELTKQYAVLFEPYPDNLDYETFTEYGDLMELINFVYAINHTYGDNQKQCVLSKVYLLEKIPQPRMRNEVINQIKESNPEFFK